MSILFLDPLVLTAFLVLLAVSWAAWSGRFRSWFGRDSAWTVAAWPMPLATAVLPVLTGLTAGILDRPGLGGPGGDALGAAVYLGAGLVPWLGVCLLPPRWLLPRWARRRLAVPTAQGTPPHPAAVPAVHAWQGRGHGSLARWIWRVDGLPGFLWVDGTRLRFQAAGAVTDDAPAGTVIELDDDEVDQLLLSTGPELHLEPPRGGWWTRRSLDVDLTALEAWSITATRPWARDGLVTLEVAGRRTLRLWVARTETVRRTLEQAASPVTGA